MRRIVVAALAAALLAAGCGGDDDGEQGSTDATTTTGAGDGSTTTEAIELTASDVGVTSTDVKVGFVLTDLAQVKPLLGDIGSDKEVQQAAYQAFVDEINAAGGISGRKITPVFTSTDPVANDGATACNKLTEDDEVFAVIANGMFGAPVLCVTQQHETPLVNVGGYATEYYDKSAGRLFTIQPSKPRSARNTVAALEQEGALQGKTVGVLTSQAGDDNVAAKTALVPALEQLDHPVARVADLAVDSGAALSQIPVEVTQMREAGVDLVFLSTNAFYSSVFVQTADEQGYRPTYALSDADDNILDYFVGRMPASFTSRGYTAKRIGEQRVGASEAALDAECRAVVEKSSGTTIERGTTAYETAMSACNQVRLFARAAEAAGPNLTRESWATAMQGLGEFELAYADGGSFSAQKFDAADAIRPVTADTGCSCWRPEGDFTPMRY
jgi:ABC-type branched-subunit amino acid transport system substrate-binding protein